MDVRLVGAGRRQQVGQHLRRVCTAMRRAEEEHGVHSLSRIGKIRVSCSDQKRLAQ